MSDERARIESVVAEIWRDVLGTPAVSGDDNFLDVGGNSLRAGEIVWRVRDTLGVELSIDTVLDQESFADLINLIAQLSVKDPAAARP